MATDQKPDFPAGAPDERELLLRWLGFLRGAVIRKIEGLSEDEARWRPNGRLISLLGIVNHLTHVEWRWIDGGMGGVDRLLVDGRVDVGRVDVAVVVEGFQGGQRHGADGVAGDQLFDVEHVRVVRVLGTGAGPQWTLAARTPAGERVPAAGREALLVEPVGEVGVRDGDPAAQR